MYRLLFALALTYNRNFGDSFRYRPIALDLPVGSNLEQRSDRTVRLAFLVNRGRTEVPLPIRMD